MTKADTASNGYRVVFLPGLGRVQIPESMTEADVLAEVLEDKKSGDQEATPKKKTKKKTNK